MHGRPRVRTTAEQEIAQQKQRAEKLVKFTQIAKELAKIRQEQRLSDPKLFVLTEIVLRYNCDVTTYWNLRKEALLHLCREDEFETISKCFNDDTTKNGLNKMESIRVRFTEELRFTFECLQSNPKSYGAWQHRCWCLNRMPHPDWKAELRLVERMLAAPAPGPLASERNFHCWDYRRFVVAHLYKEGSCSDEQELAFAETKLTENFSNFSAWHYKSKLLPKIFPPVNSEMGPISSVRVAEELEMVRNAYFLDPEDHSSWFYHHWVLSAPVLMERKNAVLRSLFVERSTQRIILVLHKAVEAGFLRHFDVVLRGQQESQVQSLEWTSALNSSDTRHFVKGSHIWWSELTFPSDSLLALTVTYTFPPSNDNAEAAGPLKWELFLHPNQAQSLVRVELLSEHLFSAPRSEHEILLLTEEAASLRELLAMEPANKWAALRLLSLQHDLMPLKSLQLAEPVLKRLEKSDVLRRRFYQDLRSRWQIEAVLHEAHTQNSCRLNLAGYRLTRLVHVDLMALLTDLNLQDNELEELPSESGYLLCVRRLNLDRNHLTNLNGVQFMVSLMELSVAANRLSQFAHLEPAFSCKHIVSLNVEENPVAKVDFTLEMRSILAARHITHSISIYK